MNEEIGETAEQPRAASLLEENEQRGMREFESGASVLKARPSWMMFDPGSTCNLRCVQCPRELPGFAEQRANPAVVSKIVGNLPYTKRLSLYGLGEPLLSSAFWDLVEDETCKRIEQVDINSNGTLFSDRNVERLLGSALTIINVSMDGATPTTYNRIRRGSFDKVVRGVRRLTGRRRELGRATPTIGITMTIMVENIHELSPMVELAADLGVDTLWAQHLVLRSDGAYRDWRIIYPDWTFVYAEQHLSNEPALSNRMVTEARDTADRLGFHFNLDPHLWLPE